MEPGPGRSACGSGIGLTSPWVIYLFAFCISIGTGTFWNACSFIAKHAYGFSQGRNLAFYIAIGAAYMLGAFKAGALTRVLSRWLTPRGFLAVLVFLQAWLALLPAVFASEAAFWTSSLGVTLTASFIWPVVHGYLTAGRGQDRMRTVIGQFNCVWMSAVAVPLLVLPPFLESRTSVIFISLFLFCLLAFVTLRWFRPAPGEPVPREEDVPGTSFSHQLRSAQVLLPLSYVMNAALNPILPYRFAAVGAPVWVETPMTAIWMILRVIMMVVMWKTRSWHGRWMTLLLSAVSMLCGFSMIVLGQSLVVMGIGFAILGIGFGVIYYAALYYAMHLGRGAVEAGGMHEGLIGLGYTVGPIAALCGGLLLGGPGIVLSVSAVVALGSLAAVRPWWRSRGETDDGA